MAKLIETTPDGIQTTGSTTYFYFGVNPQALHSLPLGAEFTCVSSPYGFDDKWESVRFVVARTGLRVKAKRSLEPYEVEHFKELIQQSQRARHESKQTSNRIPSS